MENTPIFDLIASADFNRQSFRQLVNDQDRLKENDIEVLWKAFREDCNSNLISFYQSPLADQQVRDSMNRYFEEKFEEAIGRKERSAPESTAPDSKIKPLGGDEEEVTSWGSNAHVRGK